MFDIYIKDFRRGGQTIGTETKVQSIPATAENELKLIAPTVKCDMGNAESFDFSIEGGTEFCDAFFQMKTFMRVVYDGSTIFMGRVLTVENGFRGTRKVHCEGPLAFFNDSPVRGAKEEDRRSQSVYDYMSDIISNHNSWVKDSRRTFTLGEVPGHYTCSGEQQLPNTERKYGQDGWTDTKAALEDLRSHYGGYFRARCGAIGSPITLDWMNHYFNSSVISQTVEIGKNILDISNSNEVDNIFTAIVPIGSNKKTSKSGQDAHFCLDQVYVTVPEICSHFSTSDLNKGYHQASDYSSAIDRYGYIYKTVNFDDATTKEKLYNDACEWILNNYQGEVPKFTVKAIDMHQIGDTSVSKIMVGDRVKIIYPIVNEDGSVENRTTYQTCINVQYDLYNPENNSYTFGIPANIMTKSYGLKKQTKKSATATASEPAKTQSVGSTSGGTQQTWIQKMKDWLQHHKIHYDGPKPYKEAYKANMHGPNSGDDTSYVYSDSDHYFMSNKSFSGGNYWLWKATGTDHYMRPEEQAYYDQLKAVGATAQAEEFRSQCSAHSWKMSYHQVGAVTDSMITSFNLLQYIYEEYGLDFRGGADLNGTHMPEDVELEDGSSIHTIFDEDGNVVTQQIIESKGEHVTMDETGLEYIIFTDKDNKVHYYVKDKNGNWFETTNPRSLELMAVDSDTFKGYLVEEGYASQIDGKKYQYKFGIGIETNELGDNRQLVVARMDGDVIRIGSRKAEVSTILARNVNGSWIHPYDVVDVDGKKQLLYYDRAGTASYRGRIDPDTGEFIIDPKGTVSWTGTGIWDEKGLALKGGIATTKVGDEYVTYVKSDRLIIGDNANDLKVLTALEEAGVVTIDPETGKYIKQALVAEAVYTKKVKAIDVEVGKKLTTTELGTEIGKLKEVVARKITIPASTSTVTGSFQMGSLYIYSGIPHYMWHMTANKFYEDAFFGVTKTMNGNTVTLQFNNIYGTALDETTDAYNGKVSFDIATSLLGEWSSGKFPLTVRDQAPVPHTYTIGFAGSNDVNLALYSSGSSKAHGTNKKKVVAPIILGQLSDDGAVTITRYSADVTVDATPAYGDGWGAAYSMLSVPIGTQISNPGQSFTVKFPSVIVDQPAADATYTLSSDNNTCYISRGGTVAKLWHGKYNSGYSNCWNSYRGTATKNSGQLDYGDSVGVAIYQKDSNGTEQLRDNWYWTTKSKPSVSIDIPSSQISETQYWDSSCTELTKLRTACRNANKNGDNVKFRVDAGGVSKWYIMDFS